MNNSNCFIWDNNFEVNNSLINNQHYKLVELINQLINIDLDSNSVTNLLDISNQLTFYAKEHFQAEEQLMIKYQIDKKHTTAHTFSHIAFESKMKQSCSDLSCLYDKQSMQKIIEFLINWLVYHILETDKSLFRQIDLINNEHLTPQDAYQQDMQSTNATTKPLLNALKHLYNLVSEKNKKLEEKNSILEELVNERTKELTAANNMLKKIAVLDELTGLYNRRFALTEIEQFIDNWNKYQIPFSLIFLDADKFKSVNDTYGHEKGDLVLKWIANFLQLNVKKSDIICRLGGDEFVVICIHCNHEEAVETECLLNNACSETACKKILFYWKPSFSTGIATVDYTTKTANDIIKKSDEAMYISKKNGGGQITIN